MKGIVAKLLLLVFFSAAALGQYYFGQNKIQPVEPNWRTLVGEHSTIYYSQPESTLAQTALSLAEENWSALERELHFSPDTPVPIVLYSSHNLFEETTTIPYILPEGVGGFTEYLKGRVVLPFTGKYSDFVHTLKHEMVHFFVIHLIEKKHDEVSSFWLHEPPIWYNEGIAEFYSEHGGDEMEMVMRSAILEENFVPLTRMSEIAGSFTMYKEGENFLIFLEERYGRGAVREGIDLLWQGETFEEILREITGLSLDDLSAQWELWLKKRYLPLIEKGELPHFTGRALTNAQKGIFISPAVGGSDSTRFIIAKGSTRGYGGVYRINPQGKVKLLIKGGFSERALSLHLFHNSLSVWKNLCALSIRGKHGDELVIMDTESGQNYERHTFPPIVSISSPSFSQSGRLIAFSGATEAGAVDIYVFNRSTGELTQLTRDIYDDEHPDFLDENTIIFSSDRCANGNDGKTAIYRIGIVKRKIERLSLPPNKWVAPSVSNDGKSIAFAGIDSNGAFNAFIYRTKDSTYFRTTNILTGCFEPSFWGEDSIVLSVYTKRTYELRIAPSETLSTIQKAHFITDKSTWQPATLSGHTTAKDIPYSHKLTFELAQGELSTATSMEGGGGLMGVLGDMLGERQLYVSAYTPSESVKDLVKAFNFTAFYYSQERRVHWGAGAYRLYDWGYNRYDGLFTTEQDGFVGTVSYPFSRFMRIEPSCYLYWYKRDYTIFPEENGEGGAISGNISLVRDAAQWGYTGPIEGFRGNLTAGSSVRIADGKYLDYLLSGDLRYYLRLTRRSALAFRTIGRTSGGPYPYRFYMGGSWSFRGYPLYYFYGRNQLLGNMEFRFPLVDRLYIGTPLLDIDIPSIRGALFFDTGDAWEDGSPDLRGSFGAGLRFNLDYYTVLRIDAAQRTDFKTIDPHFYYDVFFGWDF